MVARDVAEWPPFSKAAVIVAGSHLEDHGRSQLVVAPVSSSGVRGASGFGGVAGAGEAGECLRRFAAVCACAAAGVRVRGTSGGLAGVPA